MFNVIPQKKPPKKKLGYENFFFFFFFLIWRVGGKRLGGNDELLGRF